MKEKREAMVEERGPAEVERGVREVRREQASGLVESSHMDSNHISSFYYPPSGSLLCT